MLCRCIIVCFLAISFVLSGCTLMSRHYGASFDGAPDFDLDASRIPDAVPRNEPHPRFCNPASYRARGKTYFVLKTAKNYHERGIASWYGTRFYKGKTASGEPYNMLAMTAAHRTLPIPSYVRVTNLRNSRQVVVKINDRGPFKPGRVIDLSYVAAKKLGITNSGTAPVEVDAIVAGETLSTSTPEKSSVLPNKKIKKSPKLHGVKKAKHKKKGVAGHVKHSVSKKHS